MIERIYDYIDDHFEEHLVKVKKFLRIPSISAENRGLVQAARWLKTSFEDMGFRVEFHGNPKAPIVVARFGKKRRKTLLVYGMYDVQPVSGQVWNSPPFQAKTKYLKGVGPAIIARGACNSKGPLGGFMNALSSIQAIDRIPVNLVLTIEGEEEIGSPSLPAFYERYKKQLKADAGFEAFWAEYGTDVDQPIVSLGTKGILVIEAICRGGDWGGPVDKPVHSSVGAWIASPMWRLLKALSTLIGNDERILVEGFFNEVRPPSTEDKRLLAHLSKTFDENRTLKLMSAKRFKYRSRGAKLLGEYLFSPTIQPKIFSCNEGDLIPFEAKAEIVVRIVPEMNPVKTLNRIRKHLSGKGYGDIELTQKIYYPWSRTRLCEPVVQSIIETYREFGKEPQIWPLLASATPYYIFSNILKIPYAWGGLGIAGGSHSSNEFFSIEGFRQFEKSIVSFLYRFADDS
jgi:acetylornithine deacetylase/succinyl-diaminopimelate desuccinylase-like protein